jgi:hypothetical protein
MAKHRWTLTALATLGGTAAADPGETPRAATAEIVQIAPGSFRGAAENYLVMPSGGELGGDWRFVTADQTPMGQSLKFTDLALFDLSGRWSATSRLELSGQVAFLPKQPSYSDEKPWQSVGFGLRSPIGESAALSLTGGGGHLLSHQGMWVREALMLQYRKPIDPQFLSFDVSGGLDGLELSAPNGPSAYLTELAVHTSAVFHSGRCGCFGAWIGVAYAVPVQKGGNDPTTNVPIDPQPRIDFHGGAVLSLAKKWDLYVDIAVISRGDAQRPATQLPILDGGFDQRQIVLGVTRHFESQRHRADIAAN